MSRRCELTGRGPTVGHNVSHAHNITLRRWNANLHKVRVIINGRPQRILVSANAIKSGLIVKPPTVARKRPSKSVARSVSADRRGIIQEEAPAAGFFTDSSIMSRIFKPRPKADTPTQPIPGVDIPEFDAPGPVFDELNAKPRDPRDRSDRGERKEKPRSRR
jgi:large subunit ribosomal protein L28